MSLQESNKTEMTADESKQITELKKRFPHLEVDLHLKDRLIWQYLVNRKVKYDVGSKHNEVDTDWEN